MNGLEEARCKNAWSAVGLHCNHLVPFLWTVVRCETKVLKPRMKSDSLLEKPSRMKGNSLPVDGFVGGSDLDVIYVSYDDFHHVP